MNDDVALVEDGLARGPEGFGPIIDRYRNAVFGVALSRLRNFHDAEDVAQGTFLEAFERLGSLRDPSRLGAWLRSITIHRCLNYRRERERVVILETVDELPGRGSSPEVDLERNELRGKVLAAIGRLGKAQRETVTLFYIGGHSLNEIAAIQEAPIGTIKRRLHDARKKLKEEMLQVAEEVLHKEAPGEELGKRVLEMLNIYTGGGRWDEVMAEVKRIGVQGLSGFARALELPHWPSRRFAVKVLTGSGLDGESVAELLKALVNDPNKKVRKHSLHALRLEVDEQRKREEFLPLLIPLLEDCSGLVRRNAGQRLQSWAADVPLETAARALANERNPEAREALGDLVLAIIEARGEEERR
ncbi:MAG: sigma-70 family RNA polymerase sigma factor [Gemmatimonadetes bacterium]|nr:sigma-70 family RNA polymerase sigma factor [Gemmatimonadota bacterium]